MTSGDLAERFRTELDSLLQQTAAACAENAQTAGLLVALSGGPDSVALLSLAAGWAADRGQALVAAHFNHRLRGAEADQDEVFCRELCEQFEVPLLTGGADPRPLARQRGRGLEEAARHLRLGFLAEVRAAHGLTAVATGHHRDDQAETVLMRVCRGTGLDGLRGRNLKGIELAIPLQRLTVVTGVSGSGKSTAVHDTLHRLLAARLHRARKRPEPHGDLSGLEHLQAVVLVDQSPIGRTSRSTPATYTGLYGHIRKLFAQTNLARIRGYDAGRFSFNTAGGRCAACEGAGVRRLTMDFLPDVEVPCEECEGRRFDRETLEVTFKGRSIAQLLDMSVDQALDLLQTVPPCRKILGIMQGVGLGYLRLGQAAATLSGGEAQRLKLVKELSRGGDRPTLYILDEPTTGLHFCDVDRLLQVLARLIGQGNSVLVIEHNPEVIRRADWIIDLGPEGGSAGGELLVAGSLEDVAACERSYTGAMLRQQVQRP